MLRKGFYCKYKGKIYSCSLGDTEALLRSHNIEDFEKMVLKKIPILAKTNLVMLGNILRRYLKKKLNGFATYIMLESIRDGKLA